MTDPNVRALIAEARRRNALGFVQAYDADLNMRLADALERATADVLLAEKFIPIAGGLWDRYRQARGAK